MYIYMYNTTKYHLSKFQLKPIFTNYFKSATTQLMHITYNNTVYFCKTRWF